MDREGDVRKELTAELAFLDKRVIGNKLFVDDSPFYFRLLRHLKLIHYLERNKGKS